MNAHNLARSLREARRGLRFGWLTLKSFRATLATWLKAKTGLAAASAQLRHAVEVLGVWKATQKPYIGKEDRITVHNAKILSRLLRPNVANASGE